MFDKKAVFEEIENTCPEVVKVVENKKPQKYRCDENVLQSGPVVLQQIKVPNAYSTTFVTGKIDEFFKIIIIDNTESFTPKTTECFLNLVQLNVSLKIK